MDQEPTQKAPEYPPGAPWIEIGLFLFFGVILLFGFKTCFHALTETRPIPHEEFQVGKVFDGGLR